MPETKICPRCGALCDKVSYLVTPAMAGDGGQPERAGDSLLVWECPECQWEADAE